LPLYLLELWPNEQRKEGRQTGRHDRRAGKKAKKSQGLSKMCKGGG